MVSSRRRAVVACTFCRQRKRRCDGRIPTCSTCADKQIDCLYPEPDSPHVDIRNISIARDSRLERIESLLQTHPEHLDGLRESRRAIQSSTSLTAESPRNHPSSLIHDHDSSIPSATWLFNSPRERRAHLDVDDSSDLPPLTIPIGHQTSSSSLLVLPQVHSLVGAYPEEFFFRVESRRSLSPALSFVSPSADGRLDVPRVDRDTAEILVHRFFETVHTCNAILDKGLFLARFDETFDRGIGLDNESAVVLVVLALGAIGAQPIDGSQTSEDDAPGMEYFRTALHILTASWTTSFAGDIILSQGLALCALYFCYLVQPLRAWKLIHMASTSVQQILIRSRSTLSNSVNMEQIIRISWLCFLIECDILAEFHQPRSGIEPLVDKMPYPSCGSSPTADNLTFLAEVSARSLLNRVHHTVYFADNVTIYTGRLLDSLSSNLSSPPTPEPSLLKVCAELNHQLETWYDSLPAMIRPDLSGSGSSGSGSGQKGDSSLAPLVLRLRYWSAKHIIYRPFVIYATSLPPDQELPSFVLDKCRLCLSGCRMFIHSAGELLARYSPHTYAVAHTCFASILILSIAAVCPSLKNLVPDIDTLHAITVERLKLWASPGTAIECALEILIAIQKKLRYRD